MHIMLDADQHLTNRARRIADAKSMPEAISIIRESLSDTVNDVINWNDPTLAASAAFGSAQGVIDGLLDIINRQREAIKRGEEINAELAEMLAGPRDVR